jgi:hypothetical protein
MYRFYVLSYHYQPDEDNSPMSIEPAPTTANTMTDWRIRYDNTYGETKRAEQVEQDCVEENWRQIAADRGFRLLRHGVRWESGLGTPPSSLQFAATK